MEYPDLLMLGLSFTVGLGVGFVFYLGLWWTVLGRFSSDNLMLWWWASFIARLLIAASVFYLVAHDITSRYVLILLGFMLSRVMVFKMKMAR